MSKPEVVVDACARLGEGPIWDDRDGVLYWVDVLGRAVHVHDPQGEPDRTIDIGAHVSAIGLRESGGLLIAVVDRVRTLDPRTGEMATIATVKHPGPQARFNDASCDPAGRFWVGTMAYDSTPGAGILYRLDRSGEVTPVLDGITVSNGLGFTPDGGTLYYADTPTQKIDVFAVTAGGRLTDRRTLVEIPKQQGSPDGLTLDAEGCVWVALWDGAAVHRYTPDGALDRVVEFPVPRPTCPVFGGPDLDTLYATSAATGNDNPLSGALFAVDAGVAGLPPDRFLG
ncbi:MAG: SMP-30/gluconolactonase/LRE family protein [Micromonosporaceae bacterium]